MAVFVTGNAGKLREVKAILAAGDSGIEVTSQAVDGMFMFSCRPMTFALPSVSSICPSLPPSALVLFDDVLLLVSLQK